MSTNNNTSIEKLLEIMEILRSPGGCPWDIKQDLHSLKPYLLEESYEVIEAIDNGSSEEHCEELGDLLLQVVFQAQIQNEEGKFNFDDVAEAISDKLIRRHPHVFGDETVEDADEVLKNWDDIKREEKGKSQEADSILEGLPSAMPALLKAQELQKRVARTGFDWPDITGPRAKINEELEELDEAIASGDQAKIQEEMGDVFFSIVNLCRHTKVQGELALQESITKFKKRFARVAELSKEEKLCLEDAGIQELDRLWDKAKLEEKTND